MESAFFKRNISCSLALTWMQSTAGGYHPNPFSLLDSETPAGSSLFPKAPSGFSVASSIWTLSLLHVEKRKTKQLEKAQSNHTAFQWLLGEQRAGNPDPAAVQSPKWCTVHAVLLDKAWWHRNLSLLFWGGGHYPNGLLHCGNGKNTDGLNVCCTGLFQKRLAVALEPMTGDTLLHPFKSLTCYVGNVLVFSLQTDACLQTTHSRCDSGRKEQQCECFSPYFQQIVDF